MTLQARTGGFALCLATTLLFACSPDAQQGIPTSPSVPFAPAVDPALTDFVDDAAPDQQATRSALFGDLHVHTRYSFDAFIFGTRTTPEDAYRFAIGEEIDHPAGFKISMDRPLDFYAVTDHANFLGMPEAMSTPGHPLSELDGVEQVIENADRCRQAAGVSPRALLRSRPPRQRCDR